MSLRQKEQIFLIGNKTVGNQVESPLRFHTYFDKLFFWSRVSFCNMSVSNYVAIRYLLKRTAKSFL